MILQENLRGFNESVFLIRGISSLLFQAITLVIRKYILRSEKIRVNRHM